MNWRGSRPPRGFLIPRRAIVMVVGLVAIAAVPVGVGLRKRAASERLLAPVIRYHRATRATNDRIYQLVVSFLRQSMHSSVTESRAAATALCRALNSHKPRPTWERRKAWDDWRFKARGVVQCLIGARDHLRDAAFHKQMSDYHGHAQAYYQRLLDAWATKLPPFPADLETERTAVEATLRRRMGAALWDWLEPPPPSRLMPGAPRDRGYSRPATSRESSL